MKLEFHLSIGVSSITEEIYFFKELLSAEVTYQDNDYTNLNVFGAQITLKEVRDINPELPELHFGFNMTLNDFDQMAASIMKFHSSYVAMSPTVVDLNTSKERKKMYLKSPTGYRVELKGSLSDRLNIKN